MAPSIAAATNPACGSTVTSDVTLIADMTCPGTSGIVVGKSGLTINLNHFAVEGDNTGGRPSDEVEAQSHRLATARADAPVHCVQRDDSG